MIRLLIEDSTATEPDRVRDKIAAIVVSSAPSFGGLILEHRRANERELDTQFGKPGLIAVHFSRPIDYPVTHIRRRCRSRTCDKLRRRERMRPRYVGSVASDHGAGAVPGPEVAADQVANRHLQPRVENFRRDGTGEDRQRRAREMSVSPQRNQKPRPARTRFAASGPTGFAAARHRAGQHSTNAKA